MENDLQNGMDIAMEDEMEIDMGNATLIPKPYILNPKP